MDGDYPLFALVDPVWCALLCFLPTESPCNPAGNCDCIRTSCPHASGHGPSDVRLPPLMLRRYDVRSRMSDCGHSLTPSGAGVMGSATDGS